MSKELNMRSERFLVTEAPKTYSNAFGSLEEFLLFFQNRGPEMAEFVEMFIQIEKLNDCVSLNSKILPKIVESIEKEASKKAPPEDCKDYTTLFQKDFTSFKDFYGDILKAYTQNGFLYLNLNQYLRDEDWIQLDTLLPYAFCLCKAFLCTDLIFDAQKQSNLAAVISDEENTFLLYRGGLFDKDLLENYDPNRVTYFSWNGVTSTSFNQDIANIFMIGSRKKKKTPVMFIIEVPVNPDEQRKVNMLNIKPFSVLPGEEEVVLAPGSIFELVSFQKKGEKAEVRLKLITDSKKLAHQGKIMHGTMQSEVSSGKVAKIVGLGEGELIESITYLKGNRLIEELEFSLCKFDRYTEKVLHEILPTISRLSKISFISIFSDENIHLNIIFKVISDLNIKNLHISEPSLEGQVIPSLSGSKCLNSLIILTLDLKQSQVLTSEALSNLTSQLLQHMLSLTSLNINLSNSEITDDGLDILCNQGLSHLCKLTDLHLNFAYCKKISAKAIEFCSEGLGYLTSLITLDINFTSFDQITDEGVEYLFINGIRHLLKLKTLNLKFRKCPLTNRALCRLGCQGLRYITSLTSLCLEFTGKECQVTDEGVEALSSEAIRYMVNLTTLHLNFSKITDYGVKCLSVKGLSHLKSLSHLYLYFNAGFEADFDAQQKTHGGVNVLFSDGIKALTSLQTLDVSFNRCTQIRGTSISLEGFKSVTFLNDLSLDLSDWVLTAEGWNSFFSQGLRFLPSLNSLKLDFKTCKNFTDALLNSLCVNGIQHLTSLTSLHLNFLGCDNITDNGVKSLCTDGIQHLTLLTDLKLCFFSCVKLTDNSLDSLCSDGLRYVTSLTNLDLDFMGSEISDKGIHILCSEGLALLTSLNFLKLNLLNCVGVKEKGREELRFTTQNIKNCSIFINCGEINSHTSAFGKFSWKRYLKNEQTDNFAERKDFLTLDTVQELQQFYIDLTTVSTKFDSLTCLNINFAPHFSKISDEDLKDLSSECLKYLTSLRTLSMDFQRFISITDKGVNILCCQGLRYITLLTTLHLDFTSCMDFTDEGVNDLCLEGLRYLVSLKVLHISFNSLSNITDRGLSHFCSQGLRRLTSLTELSLNFSGCEGVTDEGISALCFEGLEPLTSLTLLNLNFSGSSISDEGVETIYSTSIKHLISLKTLELNFSRSMMITEQAIKHLCRGGFSDLKALTTLSLEFGYDPSNADFEAKPDPLNVLWPQGLELQNTITTLCLSFESLPVINDKGILNLSQGIRNLTSVTTLYLSFSLCGQITNNGVTNLCSEGLRHLTSLVTLDLNISGCDKITDEGIKDMCSQGIRKITSLSTLSLNLSGCMITDEGVKHLCFEGIKYLILLQNLDLNFVYCNQISPVGFMNLKSFLKYFGFQSPTFFNEPSGAGDTVI